MVVKKSWVHSVNQHGVTGACLNFACPLRLPCARLVFAQGSVSGPCALDLRYRPQFRHILDPGPGPWTLDLATVKHFWYLFGSWAGALGAGFDDSYTLSTHFLNWIGSDRIGFAIQATFVAHFGSTFWTLGRDPGRWIWRQLRTFDTLGSGFVTSTPVFTHLDRIGSDRIGSNSKESLCVDPIVKNPYVWIQ